MHLIHSEYSFNLSIATIFLRRKWWWSVGSEKQKSERGLYHTETHSSRFQSTGQSDQLIGDFQWATWSWMIGWVGSGCWLPGTPVYVPICPSLCKLPNETIVSRQQFLCGLALLEVTEVGGWTTSGIIQPDQWGCTVSEGYVQRLIMNGPKLCQDMIFKCTSNQES